MSVPSSADVVVIGGGAIGASTLCQLTEHGITDVVLVEREALASGSTGKAAGGIRLQFADELNVRIMLRSVPVFEAFTERYGIDIALRQPGYLFLVREEHEAIFRAAIALQHALGVPTRWLSIAETLQRVPQLDPAGLVGAAFHPRDGYATPESVVQGYAQTAAARGAAIVQGCEVLGIETGAGRITAVTTSKGRIRTDTVVCAAGIGSPAIGRMVGVDLPVEPHARWIHFSPTSCGLPDDLPLTIDFATGLYLHREGDGLVVAGRERQLADLGDVATSRIPALSELRVQSSWWGDYEMSPDRNALVGRAAAPGFFFYATGFSGHGFQQCPAIGEHLAERIAGSSVSLDLGVLSADRLAGSVPRPEAFVV